LELGREWIDWIESHEDEENETYKAQFKKIWDDLQGLAKDLLVDSEDEEG
jgi:hypothetical protein